MKIKTHKILRNGIFAILLSTTIANAFAKADCSNALFAAYKEYEAGKFKSILSALVFRIISTEMKLRKHTD